MDVNVINNNQPIFNNNIINHNNIINNNEHVANNDQDDIDNNFDPNQHVVIENPEVNNGIMRRVINLINRGENLHHVVMNINVNRNNANQNQNAEPFVNQNNFNVQQPRHRQFNIIPLRDARNQAGFDDGFVSYENFINMTRPLELQQAELSISYLNYLCAFGNVEEARGWIQNFMNVHGRYALYVLVNTFMFIPEINYEMYPLFTAVLWGNLEMIRMLCEYGAQTNVFDNYQHYAEEAILHVPYVHPVAHLFHQQHAAFPRLRINQYRDHQEFTHIIQEARIIAGEIPRPVNWHSIQFILNNA